MDERILELGEYRSNYRQRIPRAVAAARRLEEAEEGGVVTSWELPVPLFEPPITSVLGHSASNYGGQTASFQQQMPVSVPAFQQQMPASIPAFQQQVPANVPVFQQKMPASVPDLKWSAINPVGGQQMCWSNLDYNRQPCFPSAPIQCPSTTAFQNAHGPASFILLDGYGEPIASRQMPTISDWNFPTVSNQVTVNPSLQAMGNRQFPGEVLADSMNIPNRQPVQVQWNVPTCNPSQGDGLGILLPHLVRSHPPTRGMMIKVNEQQNTTNKVSEAAAAVFPSDVYPKQPRIYELLKQQEKQNPKPQQLRERVLRWQQQCKQAELEKLPHESSKNFRSLLIQVPTKRDQLVEEQASGPSSLRKTTHKRTKSKSTADDAEDYNRPHSAAKIPKITITDEDNAFTFAAPLQSYASSQAFYIRNSARDIDKLVRHGVMKSYNDATGKMNTALAPYTAPHLVYNLMSPFLSSPPHTPQHPHWHPNLLITLHQWLAHPGTNSYAYPLEEITFLSFNPREEVTEKKVHLQVFIRECEALNLTKVSLPDFVTIPSSGGNASAFKDWYFVEGISKHGSPFRFSGHPDPGSSLPNLRRFAGNDDGPDLMPRCSDCGSPSCLTDDSSVTSYLYGSCDDDDSPFADSAGQACHRKNVIRNRVARHAHRARKQAPHPQVSFILAFPNLACTSGFSRIEGYTQGGHTVRRTTLEWGLDGRVPLFFGEGFEGGREFLSKFWRRCAEGLGSVELVSIVAGYTGEYYGNNGDDCAQGEHKHDDTTMG
ncbi:hypothetical protein K431DRAFT_290493 [Polychaeton citri CBS 116435]|uniref:Uncharacterized protein n=1 Tax=Polychaeton citri CBS 116435 TaxID=1314669 RepID=A0A9P4QGG7_9PEZI|nr:hypothetical protein K431DRAFT_290493 [Polychaeton citri CBS 116435]